MQQLEGNMIVGIIYIFAPINNIEISINLREGRKFIIRSRYYYHIIIYINFIKIKSL